MDLAPPPGTAVVAGATGEVGEGIVAHLLQRGWRVTALGRSASRLGELATRLGAPELLTTVVAPQDEDWGAARSVDPPALVVASLGGWFSGPALTELPRADLDRVVGDGLVAHVLALQAFLPVLEAAGTGTYVMVNGAAALHPVPGSGIVSAVTAAELMLARVAAVEAVHATIRSLVLSTPVRTRSRRTGPAGWITADDVGAEVLRLYGTPGTEVVTTLPAT